MVTFELSSPYLTDNNLVWYIGFENAVFPGSDGDFNDYVFVFQNVTNETPEPSTVLAAGVALVIVALVPSRRRAYGKLHSEALRKKRE